MSKITDALNPIIEAINSHTELFVSLQKNMSALQRQVRDLSKVAEMTPYIIPDQETGNDTNFKKVSDLKGNKAGNV